MSASSQTDAKRGIIVDIGREGRRTQVRASGQDLVVGKEDGPGPYEFLLASIGACKAMTVRMYADRKGWDLERAVCVLRHDREHAEDCEHCEEKGMQIEHVHVEIQFVGDLTEDQRKRLAEIADRCPVQKTVTAGVRIKTSLVEE